MKIRSIIISVLLLSVLAGCGDSLKFLLTKRLNNFKQALPEEIREKFNNEEYDAAGKMLNDKLKVFKSYTQQFDSDDKKRKYVRGDYSGLEQDIQAMGIPQNVLDFYTKFYPIIDYECIPTFNGFEIVDFFKVYFKEKLESMK